MTAPTPDWADIRDLLATVARMRLAQRAYFAARTTENLRRAKELEAEVDRRLTALTALPQPPAQLF